MRGRLTDGADLRRFLTVLFSTSILAGAVGSVWGKEITRALDRTATTDTGWVLIGWLISGPPILVTALVWHDRRLLGTRQRRDLSYVLGIWIGLNMLLVPGLIHGPDRFFGKGRGVVDPLSTGWAWGAAGSLLGLAFAGIVLVVLYRSVGGRPTRRQVDLTARFLEIAWAVVLVASLGLALYSVSGT